MYAHPQPCQHSFPPPAGGPPRPLIQWFPAIPLNLSPSLPTNINQKSKINNCRSSQSFLRRSSGTTTLISVLRQNHCLPFERCHLGILNQQSKIKIFLPSYSFFLRYEERIMPVGSFLLSLNPGFCKAAQLSQSAFSNQKSAIKKSTCP